MHDATDLEVIQRHIAQLGIAALADNIRAQERDTSLAAELIAPTATYRALDPAPRYPRCQEATVRPVALAEDLPARSWRHPTGGQWAIAGALVALAILVVWAVAWIVGAILSAVTAGVSAVGAALPGLLGVAALIALVMLLCKGGGGSSGRRVSGTWEGRIE